VYADLKLQGDEKCNQQADQTAKQKRIEQTGNVNAPDQVEAKYKQEESKDDGDIPFLPFLHLY
jgi:hypothetical protein